MNTTTSSHAFNATDAADSIDAEPAALAALDIGLSGASGLLAREAWLERADRGLASGHRLSVLLLDIDHLAQINEAWGVAAGDALIAAVSERLLEAIGDTGLVGWIQGGCFAVLTANAGRATPLPVLAASLLAATAQPVTSDEHVIDVSVSIGIASAPRHGRKARELLTRAELALKRSKRAGGGSYAIYDAGQIRDTRRRNEMLTRLRRALARNEFRLAYQPIVGADGRTQGAEALLRWTVPGEVLPDPTETIALLEESGLIIEVGEWILRQGCRQASQWRRRYPDFCLHLNLSPLQLRSSALVQQMRDALREFDLPASALQLEITESVLMDRSGAVGVLEKLAALGTRIWIDDFGTGYSSLSYLDRMPVSGIKIDRSFLAGLTACPRRDLLLSVLASVGQTLDLDVIAEGVETMSQARVLKRFHIGSHQGFLYGAATAPEHFEEMFLS